MKRRIISSILVVVMLVLSLVSCGYSYTKDDMAQYMTFNKEAFDEALVNLDFTDGSFTTNEETRKEKIAKHIYSLLLERVGSDAEKIKEGALNVTDELYYRYYATYEKDGKTVVVYPSMMDSTNSSTAVALGDNELTGKDKAIRDEIVKLIADGKLADLKTYIYEPKTTGTADDTVAGTVAYITYTKTWKDADNKEHTETYKYERVILGETNFAAKELVGSTVGTAITDKVTVGDEEKSRVETVDGVDYTYTAVKINWIVPTVKIDESTERLNDEILVEYKLTSDLDLKSTDLVFTDAEKVTVAKDTVLTYHVNPAYFNKVEALSADIILKELLAKLATVEVEEEDGTITTEARELDCLKDAKDELATLNSAVTAYNTAKNTHDDAVKAVSDAENSLEEVKKNNPDDAKAIETAESAVADKKSKETDAATKKAEAEVDMNNALNAVYLKVNVTVEGENDPAVKQDKHVTLAKELVVADYEKAVKDVLTEKYNDEVKTNIATAVWKAMKANASVTSYPEKAVQETYDRMFEMHQSEFYTGKNSENKSHYSEHGGEFESYLIATMKQESNWPDAANLVTDYTQAKHALWSLAQAYVADIVIIYYVANLYELDYDKSEIKDFKNDDDKFFEYYEQYYGENNVLAAHQFDAVMDHFLEVEKNEDGDVVYDETTGAPTYIRIKKKA